LTCEPDKIGIEAKNILNGDYQTRYLSQISVWEIVMKHTAGKLVLPESPRQWIEQQLRIHEMEVLNPLTEDLYRSGELPLIHRDPYDRVIAAQCLGASIPLLSPDKVYLEYGCKVIW
jgi:PIN domain nuclease of toxin-antitoxin system